MDKNEARYQAIKDGALEAAVGGVIGDTDSVINGLSKAIGESDFAGNDLDWLLNDVSVTTNDSYPYYQGSLRLGRIVIDSLDVTYQQKLESIDIVLNSFTGIAFGVVKIRLHTHGIWLMDENAHVMRIHYSHIVSIEKKEIKYDYIDAAQRGINSGVGKAAIGYFLGDVKAIIDGASQTLEEGVNVGQDVNQFKDAGEYLVIVFWDKETQQKERLVFKPLKLKLSKFLTSGVVGVANNYTNQSNKFNKFIECYNREVEKNHRSGRKALLLETTTTGYIGLFFFGIIMLLIIIPVVLVSIEDNTSNKENTPVISGSVVKDSALFEMDRPKQEEHVLDDNWASENGECVVRKSGTTLSLIRTNRSNVMLKINNLNIKNCKTVLLGFDKRKADSVKCESVSSVTNLSVNKKVLKKMKESHMMTVTIKDKDKSEQTIEYSLNGFSQACDWAK